MLHRVFRSFVSRTAVLAMLAAAGRVEAHVVPNMTVEADFAIDGAYELRINVDPRTFLAADPTTLPPVPGTWYREQAPEQVAATHEKAGEYLSKALGLIFGGQKTALPACEIQAIDGADNTPLNPGTQEVHLFAIAHGSVPPGAGSFQIDFSKDANTTLILLNSQKGSTELRPQVIFPGETSRPFALRVVEQKPVAKAPLPPVISTTSRVLVGIVFGITVILLIQGWCLLNKYRHYHRGHQKPRRQEDVNNSSC